MKKTLSLLLAFALVFTLSACNTEHKTLIGESSIESLNINDVFLNFSDVSNLVSEYEGTLFVVNPDKTVSVVGTNNGNCEVQGWVDIEKIFATETATFGINSDGTCIIATNYTSYTKPEYNNASEITDNFVLLADGTVVPKDSNIILDKELPKCVDILDCGGGLFIVTNERRVHYYHYSIDGYGSYYLRENGLNNCFKNWSNVKQINYSWYSSASSGDYYYLTALRNDGKVYVGKLYSLDTEFIHMNEYAEQWEDINSCVPLAKEVFIATTNDNSIVACGREFSELGGESPKLLSIDNAMKVFNFTGTHNGDNFNYAIIICKDGSVFAYQLNGSLPSNIEAAFSKWKSFEIV